jgi:hypothetical protein
MLTIIKPSLQKPFLVSKLVSVFSISSPGFQKSSPGFLKEESRYFSGPGPGFSQVRILNQTYNWSSIRTIDIVLYRGGIKETAQYKYGILTQSLKKDDLG